MGCHCRRHQIAQPVGQTHGFGLACCGFCFTQGNHCPLALCKRMFLAVGVEIFTLQRLEQRQPCRLRRGCPLRQQFCLLAATGGHELVGIRCLHHPWQQSGKPHNSDDRAYGVHDFSPCGDNLVAGGFHRLIGLFVITGNEGTPRLGAHRLFRLPDHIKLAVTFNFANHDRLMQMVVGGIHGERKA